eukprot:6201918-Pleurochrysis_carterae.AAC.1
MDCSLTSRCIIATNAIIGYCGLCVPPKLHYYHGYSEAAMCGLITPTAFEIHLLLRPNSARVASMIMINAITCSNDGQW